MFLGKTVWLTRPEGQADSLIKMLEEKGARATHLPMLVIQPLEINEKARTTLQNLDNYNLLFFVSANAASLGMELICDYWPQFPEQIKIYAAGPATAAVIERFDLQADYPATRMSSEALLSLDSLQEIAGNRALIVKGENGRELLADELRDRGALVENLVLYQRTSPAYKAGELVEYFSKESPAAVIITSAEALSNFAELLNDDQLQAEHIPLFVSSERIADIARQVGFSQPIIMPGADDKAIIDSLEQHIL